MIWTVEIAREMKYDFLIMTTYLSTALNVSMEESNPGLFICVSILA